MNLTQVDLAKRIGVSRQTIIDIEKKRRTMTWNVFMSLYGLFRENAGTESLMEFYLISTEELSRFLTND